MGDVLRIVKLPDSGRKRPVVQLDLADGVTYTPTRDTWQFTPPTKRPVFSGIDRRYGGSREVGANHDNAAAARTLKVRGASANAALAAVEALVAQTEDYLGKYLEWRPDGATYSTYFELRGTATWAPKYQWADFAQRFAMEVELNFPIAPLARFDALDVLDDFAVDSRSDYTFDVMTSAGVTVAGGALTPAGILTTERRARHTARGYATSDGQATVKATPGATITSFKAGRTLCATATSYIEGYVDDNGTNSRLRIDVVIAGVPTNRASVNLASRIVNGTPFWVRVRREGNVVYVEHFTSTPTPAGTPTTSTSYVLTAGEQTSLPAGAEGFSWIPQHASATLDDYLDEPYTYRARSLPESIVLPAVPGDARALVDLSLTPSGGAAAPISALLAWGCKPAVFNRVWNGDFEDDVNGWVVAAVTGYTALATSITRQTAAAKYGSASGEVVAPATVNSGAAFKVFRRFKRGITYTFEAWVQSAAGTTNIFIKAGNEAGTDTAASTPVALSSTFQRITVAWTPAADTDVAYVAVAIGAATATTFRIDGVMAYEGTTAPTAYGQLEGRGAQPPHGILKAEGQDTGDLSGWAITADAAYLGGYGLKVTTSGAGTALATYYLDPALVPGDEYVTDGEVHVEIWGVVELAAGVVSPRLTLSALAESGLGGERFTSEYGSAGKALTKPSSGTVKRPVRLGTLRLPTQQQLRWKLRLAGSWATGSAGLFGVDYLTLVPARRRAASKSNVANDSSYPKFVSTTAEVTKTITSDLRGRLAKQPLPATNDAGLGGALVEMPTGDVELVTKLSNLVVDDPTSDTTTEQLQHTATVHAAVVPRGYLARAA